RARLRRGLRHLDRRHVDGPRGPVAGAVLVREHLMDDTFEEKAFAPGYGEMRIRAGDERADVALAVPVDAVAGPMPAELQTLAAGADSVFSAAQSGDWARASNGVPPMS